MTSSFKRQLKKFLRKHPDLRQRIANVLRDLAADRFRQSLRIHGLKGDQAGHYTVRIIYSYRITLPIRIEDREILFLDIGGHDEGYR